MAGRAFDLLSSQSLCFNLFAELQQDQELATAVLQMITEGRLARVTAIEFEYSPGRGNPAYLGDRSAFDGCVLGRTPDGGKAFIGIEVKYHENLQGKTSEHRPRYVEIAESTGYFDRRCYDNCNDNRYSSSGATTCWRLSTQTRTNSTMASSPFFFQRAITIAPRLLEDTVAVY